MEIYKYYEIDDGIMQLLYDIMEESKHRPPKHNPSRETDICDDEEMRYITQDWVRR